ARRASARRCKFDLGRERKDHRIREQYRPAVEESGDLFDMLADLAALETLEFLIFAPNATDIRDPVNVRAKEEEGEDGDACALFGPYRANLQRFPGAHFRLSFTCRASPAKRDCSQAMSRSSRKKRRSRDALPP